MSQVNYWCNLALYDLETAQAMLDAKRYLYVGFMCHQAVEKVLKAIYVKKRNEVPPRIHNLARLLKLADLDEIPPSQLEVIHKLSPLNIAGRYPDEELNIHDDLTPEYSREILSSTRGLYEWLIKRA